MAAIAGLGGCADPCGNEVVASVASPSGALRAVVFTRDCGATTGLSTQLSIVPAGDAAPTGAGNALILGDEVPLAVQWRSDTELVVKGAGSAQAFRREAAVAGVRILQER
jgi:hypothetical protein